MALCCNRSLFIAALYLYLFVGTGVVSATLIDAPRGFKRVNVEKQVDGPVSTKEHYISEDETVKIVALTSGFEKQPSGIKGYVDDILAGMKNKGFEQESVEASNYKNYQRYTIHGFHKHPETLEIHYSRTDVIFSSETLFLLQIATLEGKERQVSFEQVLERVQLSKILDRDDSSPVLKYLLTFLLVIVVTIVTTVFIVRKRRC